MPTYIVTSTNIDITQDQKQKIAETLTNTHARHTGAPAYFAQVLFNDLGTGNLFIGGKPFAEHQVFVHGLIRAGRLQATKSDMITDMIADVSSALALARDDIWVYLQDIDHRQMAEFGRILPAPGEEEAWCNKMSPEKLSQLSAVEVDV